MTTTPFVPNVPELLVEARLAMKNDDWDFARQCAYKILALAPGNAFAQGILDAVERLPRVTDPVAVNTLSAIVEDARSYLRKRDWSRAVDRASAARAIDPYNLDAERIIRAAANAPSVEDPQSGARFRLRLEDWTGALAATFAFSYLIWALVCSIWMAGDTLLERHSVLGWFGYESDERAFMRDNAFRVIMLTAIAGALGATINAIRSMIHWHSENKAYGPGIRTALPRRPSPTRVWNTNHKTGTKRLVCVPASC